MIRESYTITVGATPQAIARFEMRGVHVVNLPGSVKDYAAILTQLFEELREKWIEATPRESIVTEEESLAEFNVPIGSANRLCFFSIPASLVSLYRERVFPIAQDAGFVPITAVDVITPGDSIVAKLTTLIERSQLMVVDVSSEATKRELDLALVRSGVSKRILIIVPENDDSSRDIPDGVALIGRPGNLDGEGHAFFDSLRTYFDLQASELKSQYAAEPERLIAAGYYDAAIITAFALFEKELRKRPEVRVVNKGRSTPLRIAVDAIRQLIDENKLEQLYAVIALRNEIVHGTNQHLVTRQEALSVVVLLLEVGQSLNS